MLELNSKYGKIKIYAKTIEQEAIGQIIKMANSPLGENANIRIMPDVHAGAGCVIGTTMRINDKVCPNLVGVDIGCGVTLCHIDGIASLDDKLELVDSIIRNDIPNGMNIFSSEREWSFGNLRCWSKLKKETQEIAKCSLGTLGGGNHFIELYKDNFMSVHSGSRNIGYKVAEYYQNLAEKTLIKDAVEERKEKIKNIEPSYRERWLKENKIVIEKDLCYLTGQNMQDYLYDVEQLQLFASANRFSMLNTIAKALGGEITFSINSIHNYIDTKKMILRKGAISAEKDETLVIPLNMRDGLLLCRGKGNPDWNCSAPHGAGRLYSRSEAKKRFTEEEYRESMEGIFSTCISYNTLDEAPFAYKNYEEIIECIEPTVEIKDRLKPIYNFKAE